MAQGAAVCCSRAGAPWWVAIEELLQLLLGTHDARGNGCVDTGLLAKGVLLACGLQLSDGSS